MYHGIFGIYDKLTFIFHANRYIKDIKQRTMWGWYVCFVLNFQT